MTDEWNTLYPTYPLALAILLPSRGASYPPLEVQP